MQSDPHRPPRNRRSPDPQHCTSGGDASRFRTGDVLDLTIEDLAYGGDGISRVDGFVVFVAGTVPGDVVRARIRTRRPAFAQAEKLEILDPSAQRRPARCPHFGACGGCHWMNLAYETQIAHKQRQVADCLARIGRLEGFILHPIEPSPEVFGYRNKMEFTFAEKPEGVYAGLHAADDPSAIEEIRECHLQGPIANTILQSTVAICRELGLSSADARAAHAEDDSRNGSVTSLPGVVAPSGGSLVSRGSPEGDGLLRRLVIRQGSAEDGLLMALETLAGPFPQGKLLARRLMEAVPEVGGVVRLVTGPRGRTRKAEVLAGLGTLREKIDDLSLTVTAGAFLQVNPSQARRLYRRVVDLADVRPHDRALDLYCGAGAITLLLSRTARDAMGVESSSESVECAERNARDNALTRCRFVHGEAAHVTRRLAARGAGFEVVVVNPPRAGLERGVIESVASLSPSRLVYVSCDPATLARDLARFARLGYRTTDVAPFDMFPHSYHVETVVRLEGTSRGVEGHR